MNLIKIFGLIVFFLLFASPTLANSNNDKTIVFYKIYNQTGINEYNYLEEAIANSLSTKIASYNTNLKVVERNNFEVVKKELGFSNSGYVDSNQASKIGKVLGANYIGLGELLKIGSTFRLNIRLIETETNKVAFAYTNDTNSYNNILTMVDKISDDIRVNFVNQNDKSIQFSSNNNNQNTQIVNSDLSFWWIANFLYPGISQIIFQEWSKGILFMAGETAAIFLTVKFLPGISGSIDDVIFISTIGIIYIWSLIDGYNIAQNLKENYSYNLNNQYSSSNSYIFELTNKSKPITFNFYNVNFKF